MERRNFPGAASIPAAAVFAASLTATANAAFAAMTPGPSPSIVTNRQIQQASSYCLSAEKSIRAGNLKRARASLEQAIAILPNFPSAHMGLGHIALGEKRYEDALREYETARDLYAALAESILELRMRDYTNAPSEITALKDELRNEVKYMAPRLRTQRLEAAIDRLQRLEQPQKTFSVDTPANLDFYIGNALFHLNRVPEAIVAWRRCLDKDSRFAPAYQNLIVGYWHEGQIGDAMSIVARARELGFTVDPGLRSEVERAAGSSDSSPGSRPN